MFIERKNVVVTGKNVIVLGRVVAAVARAVSCMCCMCALPQYNFFRKTSVVMGLTN